MKEGVISTAQADHLSRGKASGCARSRRAGSQGGVSPARCREEVSCQVLIVLRWETHELLSLSLPPLSFCLSLSFNVSCIRIYLPSLLKKSPLKFLLKILIYFR